MHAPMFILAAFLCTLAKLIAADSVDRDDPRFKYIEAEVRTRFSTASVIKVEYQAKGHFDFMLSLNTRTDHHYKLTLSDPLNKKFEVHYLNGLLVETDTYKTTYAQAPAEVQAAAAQRASNPDPADPLEIKLENGKYKVSGKLKGTKVKFEVQSAVPAAVK